MIDNDTTPLAHDYLDLDSLFSAEELALRDRVRAFVAERIRPNIAGWYEAAHFPREIANEMGALGLLGMHLKGYGCAGRSAVEYGLAALELEAGDSGLRTFVSVQGSLAMSAIHKFGSEEQKQRWLPGMAAGELIGCFGLTEPTAGSDPASMLTSAVRDGDGWVIDGVKRWIGLAFQLAGATTRPDRVANMHFFNPALVMRCVEVVGGPETSAATVKTTTALARRLGKDPVVLHKEVPGFVANRILGAAREIGRASCRERVL